MPGGTPDPLIGREHGLIGTPVSRVDGPLKVQGEARFAAEFALDGMVYAALVYSTIPKGRIASLDTSAAEAAPGVVLVMTHRNAPRDEACRFFMAAAKAAAGDNLPIMQDDRVHWNGQPIAVVLAETQEQADHAKSLVRVIYETESAVTAFDQAKAAGLHPAEFGGEPLEHEINDAEAALAAAPCKVDDTYLTPRHNHNAIEPHAVTVAWQGDELLIHDASQCVSHVAWSLAAGVRARGETGPRHLAVRGRRVRRQDAVAAPCLGGGGGEARGPAGPPRALAGGRLPRGGRTHRHRATRGHRCPGGRTFRRDHPHRQWSA